MVDSQSVAVFDGIQNLQKDILGKIILSHILRAFGDVVKEVSFRAVFQDNVGTIRVIHDLEHRNHVGVGRGEVVQAQFPLLEGNLSLVEGESIGSVLAQGLDGIPRSGPDVNGCVDNSICASTNDTNQLEAVSQELP